MANQKQQDQNLQDNNQVTNDGPFVSVANGAGADPIRVAWQEGDTVASILERAGIQIEEGRTPSISQRRIKNPEKAKVSPGELIVIAGKPSNG